ncbi:MAG: T9SS type A sorting domain-containing protein, partial [Fibrobacter sp.]|nr:T9SS type A sorting domain-containing protein [Fibrobacter sp.]
DESISPFHHPASFWNMDKPILIGEFPANDWSSSTTGPSSGQPLKTSMKSVDAFAYAYENGYAGAMSWAMTEQNSFFGTYETTAPALKALFDAHKNDIMIKDVTITELQGDLCMKLALDLPPATYPEAEYNGSFNFTGVDSLMIDLFIPSGTSTNLVFKLVLKSTNDWIWCPSSISFTPKTTGTWVTYAVPVSSFESSVEGKTINLADIRQIVLQFYTSGTTTFKGSIYVDNARYKKGTTVTVISDFNKTGTAWSEYESGTDDNLQISISEKPAASPVKFLRPGNNPVVFRKVSLTGKKLVIGKGLEAISQVRIYDITGKVLASSVLPVSGCMIDCSNLSKGNYLVGINEGGRIQVTSIVLQ